MNERESEIEAFLRQNGWATAARAPMTPDASPRRYARLAKEPGLTAVLMSAGPDQKTDIFVPLAKILRDAGLAAPEIYAADVPRGLVLLEDFGDVSYGSLLDQGAPRAEGDAAAAEALAKLHVRFREETAASLKLPLFNSALFTEQAAFCLDHYFPDAMGRAATQGERAGFEEAWRSLLEPLDALPRSLLLRDFMPDNAMKLAKPVLDQTFGILDFQDAGIGPTGYDIASWCEEVRREGGLARIEPTVDLYLARNPGLDKETLLTAVLILSAQRHTRILGIFRRLGRFDGLRRAGRTLNELLKDDKLKPFARWVSSCKLAL